MNPVNELIKGLCPRGVQFASIGSLVQHCSTIRWTDVPGDAFRYIDLTSVDRVMHKISVTEMITSDSAPSRAQQIVREGDVVFGTTRPTLNRYAVIPAEYDGQIASTGFCVLRPRQDRILTNLLFHLLGTKAFRAFIEARERGASYPAIPDRVVKEFKVPVPPIDIQREIVQVLDVFTALEAELEAELEARRLQYAHYRDWLMTFREAGCARWIPMGELGQFARGRRFVKDDIADEGVPAIHYGEIYTRYGATTHSVVTRLRPELAPGLRFARPGDVVIVDVGETVEDVGKAVAWLGKEDVAIHDHSFAFRHSQNPSYLSYYLQTAAFQHEKAKYVARTKVKTLSMPGIARIRIPVPPPEEQARIVAILDKFDALVNDLSAALPAELNARRQQYEYYRDKLLTFKEAVA